MLTGAQLFRIGLSFQLEYKYEEAIKYFELAIREGFNGAKFHLNCLYSSGRTLNYKKAVHWSEIILTDKEFDELHDSYMEYICDMEIKTNLGVLYRIFKHNDNAAFKYYKLASDQGSAVARNNLANIYHDMQDYKREHELRLLAANQGDSHAQYKMGCLYETGTGVKKDFEHAFKWHLLAAINGSVLAQSRVGYLYYMGIGVNQNYIEAEKWWLSAAHSGNIDAQSNLGCLYLDIQNMKNVKKARKWLKAAAKQGNIQACISLVEEYENDVTNYKKALKYTRMVAKQGNEIAIFRVKRYEQLPDRILEALETYVSFNRNEGISFLFFCNFLKYLTFNVAQLNWNDKLLRPWIIKYLTEYFQEIDPSFHPNIIKSWYNDLYG